MRTRPHRITLLLLLAALACAALAPAAGAATTVWAVGDGATTDPEDDQLADFIEDSGALDYFLYLGDVNERSRSDDPDSGRLADWEANYGPSFGRFKERTIPTIGNWDWEHRSEGYDAYWGELAPQTGGGHWFSKRIGGFQVLSLSTEESLAEGSPQLEWVKGTLASLPGSCTIVEMHKPRYTASKQLTDYEDGEDEGLEPLWSELAGKVPLALTGHHHNYQHFKPNRGIVQLTAGTGGHDSHELDASDRRLASSYIGTGAIRLRLRRRKIDFDFFNLAGFRLDRGSVDCKSHTTLGVAQPKAGKKPRRAPRRVRGRASNSKSGVRLTLTGRTKKGCRSFDGKRFRRSCRGRTFKARGTAKWRFVFPRRLDWTPGRYTLKARATGLDGVKVSRKIRFRVR